MKILQVLQVGDPTGFCKGLKSFSVSVHDLKYPKYRATRLRSVSKQIQHHFATTADIAKFKNCKNPTSLVGKTGKRAAAVAAVAADASAARHIFIQLDQQTNKQTLEGGKQVEPLREG